MQRRTVLKSVAIAGATLIGDTPDLGARPSSTRPPTANATTGATTGVRRTPFIDMKDGTRLFVRDWGSGRPVLFVAPWAMTVDWFEYQMTALCAAGLRCIGYDRRGHGRSDEPGHGYDFATLSDDLAAIVQRLDLRELTIVAHSMGTGEVVRYLSRHGAARVTRLALIAPISPCTLKREDNPDGADRSALERGRSDLSKDRPGQIARAADAFFAVSKNTVSVAILDWWTRMIVEGCSLKVMVDLNRAFTEEDFRPDLRAIAVPTVILHGDSDTSTPLEKSGRKVAELIAGSRLIVYENAGHALPITHMDRANRDLLAFIKA
jgi:pimeloyl-ACP methyl ester carboxylesterase